MHSNISILAFLLSYFLNRKQLPVEAEINSKEGQELQWLVGFIMIFLGTELMPNPYQR